MMRERLIKSWLLSGKYGYAIAITWAILCPCYFFSQSLVLNPSFEDTIACPYSQGQIFLSKGWFESCKPDGGASADYFNECSAQMGVPMNGYGYQNANSESAYAAIVLYNYYFNNVREFIETKLLSPLTANKKYCVKFYVTQADISGFSIDKIGCLFTTDSFLVDSFDQEIFLVPQVENTDSVITDTMNWVLISGEFIASGGEQFLTIGNFRNDSNTSVIANPGGISSSSIYYIDDVSVTLCDTTAVEDFQIKNSDCTIFPNPNDGRMQLRYHIGETDKAVINIYDVTGKLLFKKQLLSESKIIEIDNITFESGIFYYNIVVNEKSSINKKLVIIR